LERLRQVPMIERGIGLDAVCEELIDQAVVEVEALRVRCAVAVRKHARPGNRKTISLGAEVLDEADVFLVAVIMIVGAIGVGVVADLAGRMAERIPDRGAAAVLVDGAFDLIGRGRRAPDEAGWKFRGLGRCDGLAILRRGRRKQAETREPGELGEIPARELTGHYCPPSGLP